MKLHNNVSQFFIYLQPRQHKRKRATIFLFGQNCQKNFLTTLFPNALRANSIALQISSWACGVQLGWLRARHCPDGTFPFRPDGTSVLEMYHYEKLIKVDSRHASVWQQTYSLKIFRGAGTALLKGWDFFPLQKFFRFKPQEMGRGVRHRHFYLP